MPRPIEQGEGFTSADLVDIRHVAFVNIGGVITLEFDFRRNRQTASALLDRADDFLATARHALDEGRLAGRYPPMSPMKEIGVWVVQDQEPPADGHEWRRRQ